MKLTICELSYLNELISSCVNTITCMSLFKNQVTDPELKAMLCTHFPIHIEKSPWNSPGAFPPYLQYSA